jgi:1-acyl-sn-glycerol-3-phosphate acyltransferase
MLTAVNREGIMSESTRFRPAAPSRLVLWAVQTYLRLDLAWRNRLHVEPCDIKRLRDLPREAGLVLASNHADETDFKACLELSRRCNRRFLYMMNQEAFDEGYGIAGWWLQRLGAFSVERGGQNDQAKRYAIEVLKRSEEILVIFPEGEIYYLNDLVQPFKSGVVDLGMQAVIESRLTQPDWTAYIVPMAIKYRYRRPIRPNLERRTRLMEQRLTQRIQTDSLPRRLALILAELLHRQELIHRLEPDPDHLAELSERVQQVRRAVLAKMEGQYPDSTVYPQAGTMDRTWRLSAFLRNRLRQGQRYSDQSRTRFQNDLVALKRIAQMGGWQPNYVDLDPSEERLAEMVIKLERDVYGSRRPPQLAKRDVFLRLGDPIDLGQFAPDYLKDAHAVRHRVAEQLRDVIQALINAIVAPPAGPE